MALAADIAGLCSYESFHKWHEILREALLAPTEEGCRRITPGQLKIADQKLWKFVARECRSGAKKQPGAVVTIFEQALLQAIDDHDVRHALVPRLGRDEGSSSSPLANPSHAGTQIKDEKEKDLKRRLQNAENTINQLKKKQRGDGWNAWANPKGGDKGKSKGKGRGGGPVPARLRGLKCTTDSGEPLCFAFNLDGCPNAPEGGRCPKGWHLKAKSY